MAVAWLHGVAEDTEVVLAQLLEMGFRAGTIAGVDALAKWRLESAEDYFARVRANPLSRQIKAPDLGDNTDQARCRGKSSIYQLHGCRGRCAHQRSRIFWHYGAGRLVVGISNTALG